MRHSLLNLIAPLVLPFGHAVLAEDLVIVSKGAPPLPIIVYENAPPRTRDAANELAICIEKISGQKPAVIDGAPTPTPERAIWVGVQPAVKALFPKTDFDLKQPEETVIAVSENHVVIAGRDRWDSAKADIRTKDGAVKGVQQEYGSINAVYTFLQDVLGVRWFWPGELGEDVPKRDAIALVPMERRYVPQIHSRGGAFVFSRLGAKGYGHSQDWTRHQRLQLDAFEIHGGHAFKEWWERYHEKYPEIFALQPDGTRSGYPSPEGAKMCMSNPKVWELWLEEVAQQLAADPHKTVFSASSNDGWNVGHCVCEKCSAWDHPEGEPRGFGWKGRTATRPALSDRDVTFANTLAGLLEQKYPGKGYRVEMLSYGHSRPAPIVARPANNVVMSLVANFFGRDGLVDRGSTRGMTYQQQFDAWAKMVPTLFWRPNTGSPAGWQQGLPDIFVQQTIRDFKHAGAAHCEGVFIDSTWEHWATQGPEYYVMAQLLWNPAVDADAVMADYYQRAFGAAAQPVREYFEAIEKERMPFTAKNEEAGVFTFPKLYNEALLAASQNRLDQAAAAVPADSTFGKRVAFVQAGLTHTKLMMDTIVLMERYWQNGDTVIGERVKGNWAAMEKNAADHPHAINWGPLRPATRRMVGLHPDFPMKKAKKKQKIELDLK